MDNSKKEVDKETYEAVQKDPKQNQLSSDLIVRLKLN